jgi:pimeloyl-ACP methyl ester carboxylesterase
MLRKTITYLSMKALLHLFAFSFFVALITSCDNSPKNVRVKIYDQGVNIAYTDTGKGDTTLLFVHGWCINKSYWADQAAYFSKKYRVVAIDLPGFGESGKNRNDWGTRAYSRDVDSVIAQLQLKNVILIGHSMAGDIVLQAAVDNPKKVIGLVGVDNFKNVGHPVSTQSKKEFAAAIEMLKHNFKAVALDYFKQDLFSKTTDTAIKKRVLNDVVHADSTIAAASMEQGNDFNETEKLQQVKLKLHLINSDAHPTDTNYMAAQKISFKVLYIHGTGHFPMVEQPRSFNAALEKIIEDLKKP